MGYETILGFQCHSLPDAQSVYENTLKVLILGSKRAIYGETSDFYLKKSLKIGENRKVKKHFKTI